MYQWSLKYFLNFFRNRLSSCKKSNDIKERIDIILEDITKKSYENIVKGLFNKHKLIFSFKLVS
jgi:dynein heavy chain